MKLIKNRIFLATICVVISAVCIFSFLGSNNAEEITAYRLVENVSKGTKISEDMIVTEQINSKGMEDVIVNKEEIIGKFSSFDLIKGQLIYENSVVDTQSAVLSGFEKLTEGKIAYTISVRSLASSVSDKLSSGDIVSVFVNKNEVSIQPVELKYVEVLSATTSKGLEKTDSSEELISAVTLLVSEEQALLLNDFEYTANIHLSLVHKGDDDKKQELLKEQIFLIEELKILNENTEVSDGAVQ